MKLPFSFSLKFVFRLLFPGFILAVGFSPLLQTILVSVGVSQWYVVAFILSAILLGWIVMVADMPIYMVIEGRRYWPNSLRKICLDLEQKRLASLTQRRLDAKERGDRATMVEMSIERRKFPINDERGERYAIYPTRLGNLLASYEEYPYLIYGMDSPFYWSRLWLTLDEHIQEDVDSQQALTDSAIYSTVALFCCGLLCIMYLLLQVFNISWISYLPEVRLLVILAFSCFLSGYILYRVSLHLFAQFGEIFKALFDIYHNNVLFEDIVKEVSVITGNKDLLEASDKLKYEVSWRYLHNYKVKRYEGGRSYTPQEFEMEVKNPNREGNGSI
jgi:hypothetical protein